MSKNSSWPILAGPPGFFFQARKPHTASPQGAKRIFADPSSRIHIPATSPAAASGAAAVRIAKAASKARGIFLSLENHLLFTAGRLGRKRGPVKAKPRAPPARAAYSRL